MKNISLCILVLLLSIIGCQSSELLEDNNQKPGAEENAPLSGVYVRAKSQINTYNDSIVFYSDSLTVFKDIGYGYGLLHSFTYTYSYLKSDIITLQGKSHRVKGSGGHGIPVQEFAWHNDTIRIEAENSNSLYLFNPHSRSKEPEKLKRKTTGVN
jgi:hypothetical protein